MKILIGLLFSTLLSAATSGDETLRYQINWPSGLSLGEGQLHAKRDGDRWNLEMSLEAAIPAFAVIDRFKSLTGPNFCSLEFEKDSVHGARKSKEKTVFDSSRSMAVRTTSNGGGASEFPIAPCTRDALAFLFFVRDELAKGRVPAQQTIFFGGPYQIRLQYKGTQTAKISDVPTEVDKIIVTLKGTASENSFEMYFARDTVRTPVMVRVPFAMGTFSMELLR
jgi:hypothetical protein